MAPLARKSVEPMAGYLAPQATRAPDHFVADSAWSDEQMLRRVAQWVVPAMDFCDGGWWIVDDTGFAKKGKQDNSQVAVSVSLACQGTSLPVAWQLYLPQQWADDPVRREKAGVPKDIQFAAKGQIALAQLRHLMAQGAPRHCVLMDAGPAYSGRGRVPKRLRLGDARHERPLSAKQVAFELEPSQWQEHRMARRHELHAALALCTRARACGGPREPTQRAAARRVGAHRMARGPQGADEVLAEHAGRGHVAAAHGLGGQDALAH